MLRWLKLVMVSVADMGVAMEIAGSDITMHVANKILLDDIFVSIMI